MTEPTAREQPVDHTAQLRRGVPFSAYLGVESVIASADEMRGRLAWDVRRGTSIGTLHGGALMALADVLAGLVAFLNLPSDAIGTTTIEPKTNFLRTVRAG